MTITLTDRRNWTRNEEDFGDTSLDTMNSMIIITVHPRATRKFFRNCGDSDKPSMHVF